MTVHISNGVTFHCGRSARLGLAYMLIGPSTAHCRPGAPDLIFPRKLRGSPIFSPSAVLALLSVVISAYARRYGRHRIRWYRMCMKPWVRARGLIVAGVHDARVRRPDSHAGSSAS